MAIDPTKTLLQSHTQGPEGDAKISASLSTSKVCTKAVEILSSILKESETRIERSKKQATQLKSGVFLPFAYHKALLQIEQSETSSEGAKNSAQKRRVYLEKQGHFMHGMAPASHFETQADEASPTKIMRHTFRIKKDCEPSDALNAALQGLSLLPSSTLCALAFHAAIKEFLGEERFNKVFITSVSYSLGMRVLTDLTQFLMTSTKIYTSQKLEIGDWIQIRESSLTREKHAFSSHGGDLDAICAKIEKGIPQFIVPSYGSELRTLPVIISLMLDEHNQAPDCSFLVDKWLAVIQKSHSADSLKKIQALATHQICLAEYTITGGGVVLLDREFGVFFPVRRLDIKFLEQLKSLPIAEAQVLFNKHVAKYMPSIQSEMIRTGSIGFIHRSIAALVDPKLK